MIQIKRHNLEQLAERHFVAIKEYFDRIETKIVTPKCYKAIDNWIESNIDNYNFEKIIKAKPEELDKIVAKLTNINFPAEIVNLIKLYTEFAKADSNFNDGTKEKYNGFRLVEQLAITVCPYCNRNYIHNINRFNRLRTCELDHFYPKEDYPLFAVSFYNLVPSCKVCNKLKKSKTTSYNPYNQKYSSEEIIKFKLRIKEASFYYDKKGISIDIQIVKEETGIKNNLAAFQLESLYKEHADIALELIQKSQTYNESYIDELFRKYEGTLFRSREDVLRLALGNFVEAEDFEKRPLAKFTHDIAEELGLL